jgi:hypothetical protein
MSPRAGKWESGSTGVATEPGAGNPRVRLPYWLLSCSGPSARSPEEGQQRVASALAFRRAAGGPRLKRSRRWCAVSTR